MWLQSIDHILYQTGKLSEALVESWLKIPIILQIIFFIFAFVVLVLPIVKGEIVKK